MFKDTQPKKINVQVRSKDKYYLTATWSRGTKICKITKYKYLMKNTVYMEYTKD